MENAGQDCSLERTLILLRKGKREPGYNTETTQPFLPAKRRRNHAVRPATPITSGTSMTPSASATTQEECGLKVNTSFPRNFS